MNNPWAFLPMVSSNDLLGDSDRLRARMAEDGYLYLEELLDQDRLKAARRDVTDVLARRGWIVDGKRRDRALAIAPPYLESDDEFQSVYADIQKLESVHAMGHDETLMELMRDVVGPTAFPHPLKVARMAFPNSPETTTPPHQDYPNNQGTPSLTAAWVPLGDVTTNLGGLAVLRGSHNEGVLPLKGHLGPGNRQAHVSVDLLERLRWVTTDYSLGDVLLFPGTTVHASLHNLSQGVMRLSLDFRYQQEGEALTPVTLQPHGQRVTWDDVYADWKSTKYQYYWHDLDYTVEELEDYELTGDDDHNYDMLKLKMQYTRRRERFVPYPHGEER